MNEMIGENGWRIKKIGDISSINPDSLSMSTPSDLVIKYIDIESVKPGKILAYTDFEFKNAPSRARRIVKIGDIIVSTVRPYLRAFAYVTNEYHNCICSTGFIVLRTYEEYSANYLYQYVLSEQFMGQVLPLMVGSNYPAINNKDVANITIHIPKSKKEQQRIAEILTTVDNTIEKTETLIEKYKNVKQGLMQDLLTKGIDEQGNIRSEETHGFKDSPIGRIPKEWDALTVEAAVDSVMDFRGKTPLKIGMDWGGGEITAISANNVVMGKIDLSKGTYYGSEALYKKWMVKGPTQKGDVIITMEAPLGNIAQIPNDDKYILSQRVLLLRTRSALLRNEYLALIFMSDEFQKQLNKYASGTTAQGIQQAKLFELYIPVPKLITEQQRICDYINTINKKICMEEFYLKKLCFMKQGLMQDLLTGKVRVPLEEAIG